MMDVRWWRRGGAGWLVRARARSLVAMLVLAIAGLVGASSSWARLVHIQRLAHAKHATSPRLAKAVKLAGLRVRGIDVSYYQGDIDWRAVRASGTTFAYIKATEGGDHLDSKFKRNWRAAKAAGVRRGAYHFYSLCRPVREQIAWFEANVPRDPEALPPALDMEWVPISKHCRARLSHARIFADLKMFLASLERHYGKRPVIYATASFHRDVLEGAFPRYPFWLRSVDGPPGKRYAFRQWHFWQYSAKGSLPGIRGNVDKNAFAGTPAQWARFASGT